ncbi:chemotaxis protein CheW [Desulfonema ishimotonii]|uniref:Chemotaxis protein CheW n=1 Tax=Desulfonema ishimotonii TaxID=45657 RepID=A0A401G2I8_9BACT|nr:chemotaxis protein CheW [Desulfonema ishimotonii]GBC63403.1 chemotaxis protein CheW [Desulfonema ishimotonii]
MTPCQSESCWQRIGVFGQGKPTCPELGRVIHCRNCEVFTRAGRQILERDLPDDYRDQWTDVIAAKKEEESPRTISVVIFRIGEEWLALRTRLFAEVIDPERFHSLPHRNNPVLLGVVNVHGELRLCISLRVLLDIEMRTAPPPERRIYRRMMVIGHDSEQWVFPVDEIHGVHRVAPENFQNVPVTVAKSSATYTQSLFKWRPRSEDYRNVALLEDELLLISLARSIQ